MKRGIAKPESAKKIKLTIPARTITPLEAYEMYRMGQPIDAVAGYYDREDMLPDDFYMMDRIQKFHALAECRERMKETKKQALDLHAEVRELEKQENEARRLQEQEKFNQAVQLALEAQSK